MKPHEKWIELLSHAEWIRSRSFNMRYGQSLVSSLYDVDYDLYLRIRGTVVDPFYMDQHAEAFAQVVITAWGNEDEAS